MEPGQSRAYLNLDEVALVRGGRMLLRQFSLQVKAGDAVVLTGRNGVGKSSLLRLCAGLLQPFSGKVERSARTALADEQLALDPEASLGDALHFWARLDGHPARGAVDAALEAMALQPLAAIPVRMLSTGQRKRAVLARTIASGAPLWLLDEPANGLDSESLTRLEAAMAAHRAGGGAILAASHLPLALADARDIALQPVAPEEAA